MEIRPTRYHADRKCHGGLTTLVTRLTRRHRTENYAPRVTRVVTVVKPSTERLDCPRPMRKCGRDTKGQQSILCSKHNRAQLQLVRSGNLNFPIGRLQRVVCL